MTEVYALSDAILTLIDSTKLPYSAKIAAVALAFATVQAGATMSLVRDEAKIY